MGQMPMYGLDAWDAYLKAQGLLNLDIATEKSLRKFMERSQNKLMMPRSKLFRGLDKLFRKSGPDMPMN